jgi:hypothetical protein
MGAVSLNPGRDEAVDREAERNPVIVNAWLDNARHPESGRFFPISPEQLSNGASHW